MHVSVMSVISLHVIDPDSVRISCVCSRSSDAGYIYIYIYIIYIYICINIYIYIYIRRLDAENNFAICILLEISLRGFLPFQMNFCEKYRISKNNTSYCSKDLI